MANREIGVFDSSKNNHLSLNLPHWQIQSVEKQLSNFHLWIFGEKENF
jgi:hypothetical protein